MPINIKLCDIWIIVFVLYFTTCVSEGASLRCYRNSINDYLEVELDKSSDLVNTSYIKLDQELNIVIHGYAAYISPKFVKIIENLIKVYANNKSYCALNWKTEASAYIGPITKPIATFFGLPAPGIDYFLVSAIACHIGHELGNALTKMVSRGLNMDAVYLIGHSEGAHLAGAAGRTIISSGNLIGRITGLDPSKIAIEKHLDKNCAKLVDVVHSNPHMYGTDNQDGHIDFWLNYECSIQPGCKKKSFLSNLFGFCSHKRSIVAMAESVLYPNSFQGRKADSFKIFRETFSTPDPAYVNVIGFHIDPNNTGSFYLCTKATPIYGMGTKGMDPSQCEC